MKITILSFLILLLVSCSNDTSNQMEKEIEPVDSLSELPGKNIEEEQKELLKSSLAVAVNGLDFDFGDFIVSIDSILFDFNLGRTIQAKNDTCSYDLDLGEEIENTELRIGPKGEHEFVEFEVYQRDLFHFTVNEEGPHCDLLDAEPYYSEWIRLETREPNYRFNTLKWGDVKEPKVEVSDEEFEALVLEHCGERWVSSLHTGYLSSNAQDHLATSMHELKIIATLRDGSKHTYYIRLSSMMGC